MGALAWPAVFLGGWGLVALGTYLRLRDLASLPCEGAPGELASVTLCIPARDEARELGPALDSWLAQDFPGLRILVVDDGSRDATPDLLEARARAHPERLRWIRNEDLPAGWLGKNHALDLASRQPEAREADWLLFVDADVHADPDLLRRVFAHLAEAPADLLTLLPGLDTVGLGERMFLPMGSLAFLLMIPLRRVPLAGSRAHCGVGAFTLVRREAYDAVKGHGGAPMAAIDDMTLARRVKEAGFVNRVALGGPALHLRMYHGLGETVRALRKNLLGLPGLAVLAPFLALLAVGASLGPLWLFLAGFPGLGILLWLLVPPLIGEAHSRYTGRPADLAWALWPLNGPVLAAALLWALADRIRGVNHWRGREVRIRP